MRTFILLVILLTTIACTKTEIVKEIEIQEVEKLIEIEKEKIINIPDKVPYRVITSNFHPEWEETDAPNEWTVLLHREVHVDVHELLCTYLHIRFNARIPHETLLERLFTSYRFNSINGRISLDPAEWKDEKFQSELDMIGNHIMRRMNYQWVINFRGDMVHIFKGEGSQLQLTQIGRKLLIYETRFDKVVPKTVDTYTFTHKQLYNSNQETFFLVPALIKLFTERFTSLAHSQKMWVRPVKVPDGAKYTLQSIERYPDPSTIDRFGHSVATYRKGYNTVWVYLDKWGNRLYEVIGNINYSSEYKFQYLTY